MALTNDEITAKNFKTFYDGILPYLGSYDRGKLTFVGEVKAFFAETAPNGFLICDGATYNKADYPQLANLLLSLTDHSAYEVSGDDTKFKVPDLRGEFLRGSGANSHSGQGSGANVGAHQDATKHMNSFTAKNARDWHPYSTSGNVQAANVDSLSTNISSGIVGGESTYGSSSNTHYTSRPTNTSVLYCIAYKDTMVDLDFFSCGGERFSKSDMYDTNERVIGKWIDGKPLYQKTFNGSWDVPWNNANMKGVLTGVTPLITDATLISASGVGTSGNRTICTDLYIDNDINSWTIFIANSCKLTSITLQYTKTTDTTDSFKYANPTDYSTAEKVVGTWIDGKPIYQRTYTNLSFNAPAANWSSTGIDATNCVPVSCLAYAGGTDNFGSNLNIRNNNNKWHIMASSSASMGTFTILTVQYTKTTD